MEKNAVNPAIILKALRALKSVKNIKPVLSGVTRRSNTIKFIQQASHGFKTKGWHGGLSDLAKHRDPLHMLHKGQISRREILGTKVLGKKTLSSGFRSSIGNLAANIQAVTKDVGKAKIIAPFRVAKNIGSLSAKQLRGLRYKEVPLTARKSTGVFRSGVITKGDKKFHKGWFLPKREILTTTTRGTGVVKKRKGILPATYAFSAPGMAAMTYAGAGDESRPKRVAKTLGEGAAWTIAPQLASTYMIYDMLRNTK